MRLLLALGFATVSLGCALFAPGGRYGARQKSCVVRAISRAPVIPYDDLGIVTVDCWTGGNDACEQEVLDEACRRGGDVVWGLGEVAPSTNKIAVHVARTKTAAREREGQEK